MQHEALTFITFDNPTETKRRNSQRAIRSHAISTALRRQRQERARSGDNFLVNTVGDGEALSECDQLRVCAPRISEKSSSLGGVTIDPFNTLPVPAKRLTELLTLRSSVSACEPILGLYDIVQGKGLHSMFQTALNDTALTSALTLCLTFAANDGVLSLECLGYRSRAILELRRRLATFDTVIPAATIGAILFLLGTDYRLGEYTSAQAHLHGLQALVSTCKQREIALPGPLQRAIFWQDLFSSLILGTPRIMSYKMYPTAHDLTFNQASRRIPPAGFRDNVGLLGKDLVAVMADIACLYALRKDWITPTKSAQRLDQVDGLQAWIESRLHDLRLASSDDVVISCILAAFLCIYGYWDGVWNAALLPRTLTGQLLEHLRRSQSWVAWSTHAELLLWLVYVGASFAHEPHTRAGFDMVKTMHSDLLAPLTISWEDTESRLRRFIWSDILQRPGYGSFWTRIGNAPRSDLWMKMTI